ncbi:MAG: hypothetical protein AAFX52_05295 [Pseudomonadota bacterium]
MRGLASVILSIIAVTVSVLGAILNYAPREHVTLETSIDEATLTIGAPYGSEADNQLLRIDGDMRLLVYNTGNQDTAINNLLVRWHTISGSSNPREFMFDEDIALSLRLYMESVCVPDLYRPDEIPSWQSQPVVSSFGTPRIVVQEHSFESVDVTLEGNNAPRDTGWREVLTPNEHMFACVEFSGRDGDGLEVRALTALGPFVIRGQTGEATEAYELRVSAYHTPAEQTRLIDRSRLDWLSPL